MKTDKIAKLSPCHDAMVWMRTQKSPTDAWNNCERGDWMLWVAKKLNVDDRKLTMAKYHCAAQVLHLMKDQRSLDAMTASLKYANGEITREELNAAYAAASDAAYAASDAAYAAYASDAAYAANAAAYAASDAADAYARKESLKKSADICRLYLTEEVLIKYKNLK